MISKLSVIKGFQSLTLQPVDIIPFSDERKAAFEETTGIIIPADLETWLRFSNGSHLGDGTYGIYNGEEFLDAAVILSYYPSWPDKQWLPVAGDGCGNTYALIADPSDPLYLSVCFIDSGEPDMISYIVASGIWYFIQFQVEEAKKGEEEERRWPFDEHYVSSIDPCMLKLEAALLPWNVD